MAIIKPFNAVRPRTDLVSDIAALPYDVYNRAEAKEVVKDKPYSFLRIDRAETFFDDSVDTYAPEVYAKAKEVLDKMITEGQYITDDHDCYYIYELIMDGRSQNGIVALASIDDYKDGIIKKHENTRADKEIDRITHVDTCNAQTGPIFLAYRAKEDINALIAKTKKKDVLYSFTSEDGITHNAWVIDNADDVAFLKNAFENINEIYIADGHHRAASAVKVGLKRREANPNYDGTEEFNFFLSVLFPDEELKILPYNRVVKDLNGFDSDEFLARISEDFDIEVSNAPVDPEVKGTFGMYLEGKWYKLTALDSIKSDDPVKGLDVSILQDNLLEPVLAIKDPRTDKRIDFVGGIRGLKELERRVSEDMYVAFSMYPTSIKELFDVADAGLLMPPKSTWFEPKLRSGIFIHKL